MQEFSTSIASKPNVVILIMISIQSILQLFISETLTVLFHWADSDSEAANNSVIKNTVHSEHTVISSKR